MANFQLRIDTSETPTTESAPVYRVKLTTSLINPNEVNPNKVDGHILLIKRSPMLDKYVDSFYGVVKAGDFGVFAKKNPNAGHKLYRIDSWTLVFYNKTTMTEALALLTSQVNALAPAMTALALPGTNNQKSTTSVSSSF